MIDDIYQLMDKYLPGGLDVVYRVLWCLAIFLVGRKLIGLAQRMAEHSFERAAVETGARKFLNSCLYFALYAVLFLTIADQIGIDSASIVAVLGSAGLALGLALQESLKNFAGGVLILLMKPFKVGDYIVTDMGEGTVSMIGLVYTTMLTVDNRSVVIPNGTLANSPMTNTTGQTMRRLYIKLRVPFETDVREVKKVIRETLEGCPAVLRDQPMNIYVDDILEDCMLVSGFGWVNTEDYWQSKWDVTEDVKLRLDQASIPLAHTRMDVRLVGGDGEKTRKGESQC